MGTEGEKSFLLNGGLNIFTGVAALVTGVPLVAKENQSKDSSLTGSSETRVQP